MSDASLGQRIQTFFLVFIIGLLSLIMAVVGFSGPGLEGCNSEGPGYAAQVYGETISEGDFRAAYTLVGFNRYPAERAQALRLREYTLDGLIETALLVREAERLGFTVDRDEIMRRAAEEEVVLLGGPIDAPEGYPQGEIRQSFRERDGAFSADYFRRFIQHHLRRSVEEFVNWQEDETLANRVRDMVTSSVSVSPQEVWDAYVQENDRAQLAYVRFDPSYYRSQVEITDEAVEAWMEENSEAVDTEYRRQRHRYTNLEEQTRARHILIEVDEDASQEERDAARRRAEGLLQQVLGGADFAALAREHSDDEGTAARGGDIGWFPRGRRVAALTEAAFSQEPGTIRDELVESNLGFHVLKVEGRREGDVPEDEAKRELAEGLYRAARAGELAREDAERALAYLREGHSPEELDERLARGWEETPEGETPEGETPEGETPETETELPERAPNAPQVRETLNFGRAERAIAGAFDTGPLTQAAFEMTLDDPLPEEPLELGDSWFVFQLISRTVADEEGFDDTNRERLERRLLDRKRQEVLAAYIGQLRQTAEANGAIRINNAILSYGLEEEIEEEPADEDDEPAEEPDEDETAEG